MIHLQHRIILKSNTIMSEKNQSALVAIVALFVLGLSAIALMSYRLFYIPSLGSASAVAASGSITFEDEFSFAGFDESFTLDDGQGNTSTFHIANAGGTYNGACSESNGSPVFPTAYVGCNGQFFIDVGGGPDTDTIGSRIASAINTSSVPVGITASYAGSGVVNLVNDVAGTSGNVPIVLSLNLSGNASTTFTGMSGGGLGNNAPTVSLSAVSAYQTGTGEVSISATVNDDDNDQTRLKIEYTEGSDCLYVDTQAAEISAGALGVNSGALTIDQTAQYQIQGIDTSVADEFVSVTLDLKDSLPTANGTYCIHVTPNDETDDGTRVTSTVILDNVAPTVPGELVVASTGTTAVVFTLPTTNPATDTRFSRYTIYYTEGTPNPTTTDSQLDGLFEPDLAVAAFGAPTTTITDLTAGTQYTANLFAYDTYGNFSSATNSVTFTLQAFPTATLFSTELGTTNFASSSDLSALSSVKLAKSAGSITWTNAVSAIAQDYDTNVLIGSDYVSVNTSALDSSANAAATVAINDITTCDNYTIYSAESFYSSASNIITNGQECNSGTTPACTVVSCSASTLTFTVPDFSSKSFAVSSEVVTSEEETTPASSGGASSFLAPSVPTMPVEPTPQQNPTQASNTTDQSPQTPVTTDAPAAEETTLPETPPKLGQVGTGVKCSLNREAVYRTGIREDIYYVDGDCKRGRVRSAAHFFTYFDSFTAVQFTSQALLDDIPFVRNRYLPLGPKYSPPEGSLIKIVASPRVYLIQNNTRRWIQNAQIFQALGFRYAQVVTVVPEVLQRFIQGVAVQEGEQL